MARPGDVVDQHPVAAVLTLWKNAPVDAQLRKMLNETEQELIRSTEQRRLNKLDEDELTELHDRIRRARNKYSKLYRRRAAQQVESDRSRKRAHDANVKAARKAEGFEDALARVSRRLADVAEQAAEELKAERLAAAQRTPTSSSSTSSKSSGRASSTGRSSTSKKRTPASEKQRSSHKAANQRRQAARDRRS